MSPFPNSKFTFFHFLWFRSFAFLNLRTAQLGKNFGLFREKFSTCLPWALEFVRILVQLGMKQRTTWNSFGRAYFLWGSPHFRTWLVWNEKAGQGELKAEKVLIEKGMRREKERKQEAKASAEMEKVRNFFDSTRQTCLLWRAIRPGRCLAPGDEE